MRVEYKFDPSVFGTVIMVVIDHYRDPRWYFRIALDEFIIKDLFDNEEETSKLISEIVGTVLDKYKEHLYKRYFFD